MIGAGRRPALAAALALSLPGCATLERHLEPPRAEWLAGREAVRSPENPNLRVRFSRMLGPGWSGDLIPRERASVALDPQRNRMFVATSRGMVYALDGNGRTLYEYDAQSELDATPVLEAAGDTLFIVAMDGSLHALDATTGRRRYKADVGHPMAEEPIVVGDTLFVVADDDVLCAVATEDGGVLWRYRRPQSEEISVSGHAGIALVDDRLIVGFDDGMLAAIRANDGSVFWELDTSLDVGTGTGPLRLRDVDTTPTVLGGVAYVASFAGGLYAVDIRNGTVLHRDNTYLGITSIQAVSETDLLVASSDRGLARIEASSREVRWQRTNDRGTPGAACIVDDLAIFGESRGSLIALHLDDGHEVARFESGNGFVAEPRHADGLVVTLSNGSRLFALELTRERQASTTRR